MDSSLISELSDLSYKSIGGKRQPPRGAKEDIVNIGTIPFEATITPDKITKEMIMDYQKNKDRGYIDPITNIEYKYIPTGMNLDVVDSFSIFKIIFIIFLNLFLVLKSVCLL